MTTTPHAANMSGRPANPDTGNPLPTPTTAQLNLVAEVLRGIGYTDDPDSVVHRAMVEAVVREHGRTLRACRRDLDAAAEQHMRAARDAADLGLARARDGGTGHDPLVDAGREATRAQALRTVMLRGEA